MNPAKVVLGGLRAVASIESEKQREVYFDAIQSELNKLRGHVIPCNICGGIINLSRGHNKSVVKLQTYYDCGKQDQFQAFFVNDKFGTVGGVGDTPQSAMMDLYDQIDELSVP